MTAQDDPAPGVLYTLAGRTYHLYCTGTAPAGSPTVILEAGVGGFSMNWQAVQPQLAEVTRVCSHDRPAYGWSSPVPARFDMQQHVADLHALLALAGEAPPYILVGHSFGGVLVRSFATTYPAEVSGMLLVDAVHPALAERIPYYPAALQRQLAGIRLLAAAASNSGANPQALQSETPLYLRKALEPNFLLSAIVEAEYMVESLPALDIAPIQDVPLIVLARGVPEQRSFLGAPMSVEDAAKAERIWQGLQRELAITGELRIAEGSGHNIQTDQPEMIVSAVQALMDARQP